MNLLNLENAALQCDAALKSSADKNIDLEAALFWAREMIKETGVLDLPEHWQQDIINRATARSILDATKGE